MTTSAMKLADDLGDAVVSQMKEFEEQIVAEQISVEKAAHGDSASVSSDSSDKVKYLIPCSLPMDSNGEVMMLWDARSESASILSQDLMERALALSTHESNFTQPPATPVLAENDAIEFSFQALVPAFMKMLQVDLNLSRMHAKLTPKMPREDLFWRHYYLRLVYLRCCVGIDRDEDEARLAALQARGETGISPDELAQLRRERRWAADVIQLKKQISRLDPADVLSEDTETDASADAAATAAREEVRAAASTAASPARGAGRENAVTDCGESAAVEATPPASVPRGGSLITRSAQQKLQKKLVDQELDDEIEAELNDDFVPSRTGSAAPGSSSVVLSKSAGDGMGLTDEDIELELEQLEDLDLGDELGEDADLDEDLDADLDLDDLDAELGEEDTAAGALGMSAQSHATSVASTSTAQTSIEVVPSAAEVAREMQYEDHS